MKLLRHAYIHTSIIISTNAAFFHPQHNHHYHHVSTISTTTTTKSTSFQMLNNGKRKRLNRMLQMNMIKKKKKQQKKQREGGDAEQDKGDVVAVVLEEQEIGTKPTTTAAATAVKGKSKTGKKEQKTAKSDDNEKDKVEEEATNMVKQKKSVEKEVKTKKSKKEMKSISGRYMYDNDLYLTTDEEGRVIARSIISEDDKVDIATESDGSGTTSVGVRNDSINDQRDEDGVLIEGKNDIDNSQKRGQKQQSGEVKNSSKSEELTTNIKDEEKVELPKGTAVTTIKSANEKKRKDRTIKIPGITLSTENKTKKPLLDSVPKPVISSGFNVVLTHCTADFDSLASAVGLAKLWSTTSDPSTPTESSEKKAFESSSALPTFVVLPRGAHPSVQRFLGLHKHLFPIRSLRSLPKDLSKLHRLGLVDAQSRDRIGPAEILIGEADRVTIVDHHIDGTSDISEATDYIIDHVGAVSTMVAEKLRQYGAELSEAEATLLALGIHADTGSLCFDSSTTRDAEALAWVMSQGASQAAIAEHAHSKLSREQQGVLTNALINTNSTVVHGVTVSTVLLR